ncbi:MAG: cysteine hydrolase family protein [Candidatus Bathyarchaeota archaeon]|jgi:nicotinamidase-related amidase
MKPEQIALVLIDIQKDFWEPMSSDQTFKAFPENVAKLLSISREKGYNIIHVRSVFQPDRSDWMLFYRPEGRGQIPCIAGTEGTEFTEFAKPNECEKIIEKQTFDAFIGTGLDEHLQSHGIKTVLIAGLETSVCVLFTANSAYLRKYLPLVMSDACADTKERHENALEMYGDLSFKTITTSRLIDDIQSINELIKDFV